MIRESSERVRASAATGSRHVRAEQTNDLDAIMGTISRAPYFPLLDHDGRGGLALQLLTDTDAVARYYGDRHGSYEIVGSQQIIAVTTGFYTFRESVATLRPVGEVGGVATDGSEFRVNSAVLFPTSPDGIGGELVWTRYPFGEVVSGRVEPPVDDPGPAHLPNRRVRIGASYDEYVAAWRDGDVDRMLDQLSPDCCWQRRVLGRDGIDLLSTSGHDETRDALTAAVATHPVRAIEVCNRVVTDWYVFADLHLELGDGAEGSVSARHIALHPVAADGRLRAELGELLVL